ncbi:20433_t:CDS:2, partial [Gigaspora margarita]
FCNDKLELFKCSLIEKPWPENWELGFWLLVCFELESINELFRLDVDLELVRLVELERFPGGDNRYALGTVDTGRVMLERISCSNFKFDILELDILEFFELDILEFLEFDILEFLELVILAND